MCAEFHQVGEPANEAERDALRFLRDELPEDYIVYGNPWIVQHSGQVFEVDAVVVGEHAIYVVEMKAYRGRITGNEHDWTVRKRATRSPVKLNRKTAQILKTELKRKNGEARRIWVQGFVFLTHTELNQLSGQVCRDMVYTRSTILGALKNVALVHRLSGAPVRAPSPGLRASIGELLKGADRSRRPPRTLGGYQLRGVYDRTESYVEHHGYNEAADTHRILRFWEVPPLAPEDQRLSVQRRARWESRVLEGLHHRRILRSYDLLEVDVGYVLPMEYFPGLTLTTWLERHGPRLREVHGDDIPARVALWRKIAEAMRHAHGQGVVHRLLRPEVVRVEDTADNPDLRVGGFDLAKRLRSDDTVSWTAVGDERLDFAAPEIVNAFTDAGFESDQFSLGALLGLLLAGKPLFASTLDYMQKGRLSARPSDFNPRIPGDLDAAVVRMLALRSPERFASLEEAEAAVAGALERRRPPTLEPEPLHPDHLAPGVHLGDFDVLGKLGEGGLGVVYSAIHRATGSRRALKVAKPDARDALLREHKLLEKLHHPGLVTVRDPSETILADRLVLVMEHVEGETLRQWLEKNPGADARTRHRFAEDLLGVLEYLEQEGVTHNDLKPDNLLVGKGGLRVIDFSLASEEEAAAARGGTSRYRDPATLVWSHASDRYAAALCLFELFVGRHAFGGRIRGLDEKLHVEASEVDPPGLAELFRVALHHQPNERFDSVLKMRQALRQHLGDRGAPQPEPPAALTDLRAETQVHRLALSNRAVNQLRRAGISTAGALLALEPEQIRTLRSVGTKTAGEILRVQDEIRQRGLEAVVRPQAVAGPGMVRPALFPELIDDAAPAHDLPGITESLAQSLAMANLGTVGRIAGASRKELLEVPTVGPKKIARLLEALRRHHDRTDEAAQPRLIDEIWQRATAALSDKQREVLDGVAGLSAPGQPKSAVAKQRGISRQRVDQLYDRALESLDLALLDAPAEHLETLLASRGGIVDLGLAGESLEAVWLPEEIDGRGLARFLAYLDVNPFQLRKMERGDAAVLTRPDLPGEALKKFEDLAWQLAESWPPVDAGDAARQLRDTLPGFLGDPLDLAARLFHPTVCRMAGGELFVDLLNADQAVEHVLARSGHDLTAAQLADLVDETFGGVVRCPDGEALERVFRRLRPRGVEPRSIRPAITPRPPSPSAHDEAGQVLRAAARSRGFRIVLTPPEKHRTIGPTVAALCGAEWLSFEDLWFQKHQDDMERMVRAERFAAQRKRLTRSADKLLEEFVDRGEEGKTYVIGDTALLGTLDALENVRFLYDLTLSGEHGCWILVIPGSFAEKRQPYFNDREPVWHLEGIVVQVEEAFA